MGSGTGGNFNMNNINLNNINLGNLNMNDPEHQRIAAAALQAQLEQQHALGYGGAPVSGVPEIYNPNYYQQGMANNAMFEDPRRMAMAFAAAEQERNRQASHNLYQDRDMSEMQMRNNFYGQDVGMSNQGYTDQSRSNSIDSSSPYTNEGNYVNPHSFQQIDDTGPAINTRTSGNMDSLVTMEVDSHKTDDKERVADRDDVASSKSTPSKRKKSPSTATPKGKTTKVIRKAKLPAATKKEEKVELNTGFHVPLTEDAPDITPEEYANLDALMTQFCKVPLLAEFSRPVSLLHPELTAVYNKVVHNPIDLGKVSRAIRKREYSNTRQICLDVWRIFTNCVKYHTHPITREGAIPSFVSIANHLREYFNALWLEFMIPSEASLGNNKDVLEVALTNAEEQRNKLRRERFETISTTIFSDRLLAKAADAIDSFIKSDGKVDNLDQFPICGTMASDDEVMTAIQASFTAIGNVSSRLRELVGSDIEYTVENLNNDLKRCYGDEVFEGFPWLKIKFEKRLERLMGKLTVPIFEISCRGVNQSSVWGCMAAAIWARENMKKPFWPALVLGILAPEDQSEDWHSYLTERNESRLPEKLLSGLVAGKKKAIQAIERQSAGISERMSYFLVEFLGTHEFIWVREADIVENFDPAVNINENIASTISAKKKSFLRGVIAQSSKMLAKATDEGRWALEEFDLLMNDPCGDQMEMMGDEYEEENYSFSVLCESDAEADEADKADKARITSILSSEDAAFKTPTGDVYDLEEINELLSTNGLLDFSAEGKKSSRKRALALRKIQADAKKTTKKKEKKKSPKESKATKPQLTVALSQKDAKDVEKRRKKRQREREKFMKDKEKNAKKFKTDSVSVVKKGRKLGIVDKRGRAASIVRGYLNRIAAREGLKGLSLGGLASLPAANVEGSGILGIALAFRAAAGELEMPDTKDNPSCIKPWEHIAVNGLTSDERCIALNRKIELLQQAIVRLDKDTERRLNLIKEAEKMKEDYDLSLYSAESEARQNDIPKRKPQTKHKDNLSEKDSNAPNVEAAAAVETEPEESVQDSIPEVDETTSAPTMEIVDKLDRESVHVDLEEPNAIKSETVAKPL